MKIIKAYPPLYSRIVEAFPYIKGRPGILFAWGDRLYYPNPTTKAQDLPVWIEAHEEVHGKRQMENFSDYYQEAIEDWWDKYIADPEFRLQEEIPAHQAEWRAYRDTFPENSPFDPCPYLTRVAERLSGPLYGNLISYEEARKVIQQ